ncbi:MAG: hypothetical protein IJO93_05465 [Clostridia bacterium]|nr:hypothetical protein [Clostridia bacterium]
MELKKTVTTVKSKALILILTALSFLFVAATFVFEMMASIVNVPSILGLLFYLSAHVFFFLYIMRYDKPRSSKLLIPVLLALFISFLDTMLCFAIGWMDLGKSNDMLYELCSIIIPSFLLLSLICFILIYKKAIIIRAVSAVMVVIFTFLLISTVNFGMEEASDIERHLPWLEERLSEYEAELTYYEAELANNEEMLAYNEKMWSDAQTPYFEARLSEIKEERAELEEEMSRIKINLYDIESELSYCKEYKSRLFFTYLLECVPLLSYLFMFAAMLLFALNNKIPEYSEKTLLRAERNMAGSITTKQAFEFLQDKLALGMITEQEYAQQRTEIIQNL